MRSTTTPAAMVKMYLLALALALLSLVSALPTLLPRQAPNQMYIYNPTDQTGSFNFTTFIVPIPLSDAYALASPYELILTHGLPASIIPLGSFPLQITAGYYYDIRQRVVLGALPAQVQQLSVVEVYVPFVDVLGGGGRAFRRSVVTYMDQLVPMLVGGVTQFHDAQLAYFDPAHAAYKPAGGNDLSFAAAQGIVNTLDGPGLVNTLFQTVFARTSSSPISATTFRAILDQPYYTTAGQGCNQATLYYNYSNASPGYVSGNVQTFTPLTSANANYDAARGYTAAA
ncbi:uncharacterized protein SRS1_13694 [Sporisorium reilianum f. sp. reilianum]|uniref:Uncharacterized protein n=1 Tax=Sporisorium reilianum f. sp. reilianum TaxID=72559 RepID=A0A2N8UCY6_9BASI|nr:uncharacterized protein SRS1_13694 [Sporisorium reilianum f. sp. reilianum]